jgi:biotin carboxyl carrier protein
MIPGSAWNWITVNLVQQSNLNEKMKQKTLIYMVIKPSIVLAAAVLTAASFLAPSTAQHVQSITVPIMGEGIRNAKIVSLLKKPGEQIQLDDELCEVETDKAVYPIQSSFAGVMGEWKTKIGDTVEIGQELGTIVTSEPAFAEQFETAAKESAAVPAIGDLGQTGHKAALKEPGSTIPATRIEPALSPITAADPTYLMPTGPGGGQPDDHIQPFDPNPAATGSRTRKFLTYGSDADGIKIPLKTLRITNNTTDTVYPIMRDPNSNVLKSNSAVGLYDPYDPPNKEYRGYIGYKEGTKYYFGLKSGQSILVSVPLVFWNAARIGIGTDGQYLTPAGLPNPLRWRPNGHRSITNAQTSGDTIPNGVVMWYRADIAEAPNDDTKDQLAEWTIRDHRYLVNDQITKRTNREIPDTQLVTLINYDVSNVDNLYLPLAMEANDVWVVPQKSGTGPNANRCCWQAGKDPDIYGWTGAIDTIDFLQTRIREFTAGNNQLLGQYFGSKRQGWPFYNIPNPTNDPNAPLKIPSGANVFAQSPLRAVPSSYGNGQWQNDKYMLSSGGTKPISATIGWAGGPPDQKGSTTLHLNPAESYKIAFIEKDYLVTGRPPCAMPTPTPPTPCVRLPNPIQNGTTVLSVNKGVGTVTLSKPLVASSRSCAFTFTRPVDDYASDAMIKLWYSWAQYYLAHWKDQTPSAPTVPTRITGSIDAMTATLTFNTAHSELVEGMAVKGPGLDDAMTEKGRHQGHAVILQIAGDKKSVILSQVANKASTNATFTVLPPRLNPLLWTPTAKADPGYPLIGDKFKFSGEPKWHNPYEFSQQVYLIMASMNQIGRPNNDSVSKYMQDIVGANMGFIFTQQAKDSDDGKMVTSMIRDMIKSVLRGVTDFTEFPDKIEANKHVVWYPNPSLPSGNQPFNVFNLDPFVWFVHVQLGFSGYGFSVDDDTADVGAGGASKLQLTVTKKGGLKNTNPWTIQAPYGPVKNVSLPYSGKAVDCRPDCAPNNNNGDTLYDAIASVSNERTRPIKITTKSQHHLSNGDTVVIDQVTGDKAANGRFKINNVTSITFALFDPLTGTTPIYPSGTYTGGGRWSYPLHPYIDSGGGPDLTKVYYRVTGDDALGTFQGTLVSANSVVRNKTTGKPFRVWRLGRLDKGRLLLDADLTDAYGTPLPRGTYTFTFFGQ